MRRLTLFALLLIVCVATMGAGFRTGGRWGDSLGTGFALSPSAVQGEVYTPISGIPPGVWGAYRKGYWSLVSERIDTLTDISSQGHNLTPYSSAQRPYVATDGAILFLTNTHARYDDFPLTDAITLVVKQPVDTGKWFWDHPKYANAYNYPFCIQTTGSADVWTLAQMAPASRQINVYPFGVPAGAAFWLSATATPSRVMSFRWNRADGAVRIWADGIERAAVDLSPGSLPTASQTFCFGDYMPHSGGSGGAAGDIDAIYIYRRYLTDVEVSDPDF